MAHDRLSPVEFYEREVRPRLTVDTVYRDVKFSKTRGRYWRGPCPLHGGDGPNFSVDTETLGWRCFTQCQKSGSALAFLNGGDPPRGADFVALVRTLAGTVGVDTSVLDRPRTPEEDARHEQEVRRETVWEAFLTTARAALGADAGTVVRQYLVGRGFVEDELGEIGFGVYVSPEAVTAAVQARGVSRDELKDVGLLDPLWTGRLVIPWRDRRGHARSCAARDVTGKAEDAEKYLYPVGTRKAELVAFGLDVALGKGRRDLILVEGLLDVVLLQARGLLNVAAIGGAGGEFSPERWAALQRFGVRSVMLVLDNDDAGRTGTRAALDNALKVPVTCNVSVVDPVDLAPYKDPDELVRTEGVEAFRVRLLRAFPWAFYMGQQLLDGITPESPISKRRATVETVLDFLAPLHHEAAALDREELLTNLAARTGYTEAALTELADERAQVCQQQDADRELGAVLREVQDARGKDLPSAVAALRAGLARVDARTVSPPSFYSVDRLDRESRLLSGGLPSGWATLDTSEEIGGLELRFNAGELAYLAARTSHGKTSALVSLLLNWLLRPDGGVFVLFSLDEPEVSIHHRLLALLTALASEDPDERWSVNRIRGYLQNPESRAYWPNPEALNAARAVARGWEDRLVVVHRPGWFVSNVNAYVRELAARRPVVGVLVDYVQRLMPHADGFEMPRDLRVALVGRELKALAVEVGVPVVAGAQIGRQAVTRANPIKPGTRYADALEDLKKRRPDLHELREGGSEQEADLVLGVMNYRADFAEDVTDESTVPDVTRFDVGLLKNRYGPRGRWTALAFEGRYHYLRDPRSGETL